MPLSGHRPYSPSSGVTSLRPGSSTEPCLRLHPAAILSPARRRPSPSRGPCRARPKRSARTRPRKRGAPPARWRRRTDRPACLLAPSFRWWGCHLPVSSVCWLFTRALSTPCSSSLQRLRPEPGGADFAGLAQHLVDFACVQFFSIDHLPGVLLQHDRPPLDRSQQVFVEREG